MPIPISTPTVGLTPRKRVKTRPTPAICPATYTNETTTAASTATIRAFSL